MENISTDYDATLTNFYKKKKVSIDRFLSPSELKVMTYFMDFGSRGMPLVRKKRKERQ